ncbi:carboxypeptidase-like regulatory domain-containing protein [Streptomyces sp. NPDC059590]|uniref:carboxypeptidase-like regulatory domain-containing protein n=1 Tax=Streptomyces sp. NPDC059590 TaxID=3346877 RepID=UPI0036C8C3FD
MAPGSYTLTISAEGHRPHAERLDVTGHGQPPRIDAELRPAAKVRGTVRARGGRPVEDARVTLLDSAGDVVGQCLTGADGAFSFAGLTGEHYTVVAGGYAPATVPVTLGGSRGARGAQGVEAREVDFLLGHG